jgi:PAS domain S-box-containing protein
MKSGEKIPYYLTGVLTKFDDMPCVIGTGINISKRKKAERELYDSEQKYKMLFENNPLPMWMFTIPERNVIDVNKAAVEHYGYSKEEFLELNLLDLRPDEDKNIFIQETKNTSFGVRNAGIWRHKKKDGTIIHVEIFRDDIIYKGRQVRLVLANDISDKFITEQQLKESHEELRNLASHLQDVREEERAVIAREIHDELGQQITGLKMDVSWISKRIITEDANIHHKVKSVLQLLDETVKTVRKIATELRPSILDDLGLIDALQWYSLEFEKRFGITVSFHTTVEEVSLPKNVAIGLFRIYQESLTNVARHANASFVKTDFTLDRGTLRLTITDNGKGFDTGKSESKKTLGLLGMKERTLMMGGTYIINSIQGKGTTVYISVPMQTT